jgi:RNA polymerase sigma-54 factor
MSIKQTLVGRLGLTFSLTQALTLLELPQIELASWLLTEIEKNPLLELDAFPRSLPLTQEIEAPETLHDHLMQQIREHFPNPDERQEAILILEQMDERGFVPHANSPLLPILQSFDPPGIFARDLRECLLLQLKEDSPAHKVVTRCFEELLQGKFGAIKKKIGVDIATLPHLNLRPADLFREECNPTAVADLIISQAGDSWSVELTDEELPKFHLRDDYPSIPTKSIEEKENMQNWARSGKWVLRSLERRKSILLELGSLLVRKQPISIHEMAKELELHESTLYRALNGKYALTPEGLLPLRSLVQDSTEAAKNTLRHLIAREKKPLSDAELVLQLKARGETVARRTVAKYRAELNIAPASRRKLIK